MNKTPYFNQLAKQANMTTALEPIITFMALPGHLAHCHSWCGYSILSLPALSPEITSDQVELITVNGLERKFRPMCDKTLMLIPSLGHKLEAQIVRLYGKEQPDRPWQDLPNQAMTAAPDLSMGLGKRGI